MINARKIDVYTAAMTLDRAAFDTGLHARDSKSQLDRYQARKDLWEVIGFNPLEVSEEESSYVPVTHAQKARLLNYQQRHGYTEEGAVNRLINYAAFVEKLAQDECSLTIQYPDGSTREVIFK